MKALLFLLAVTVLVRGGVRVFAGGDSSQGASARDPFPIDFEPDGSAWIDEFTRGNRLRKVNGGGRLCLVDSDSHRALVFDSGRER